MHPDLDRAIDSAATLLDASNRIGVVGHVGPDGDALGSMLALTLSAVATGRSAFASFDNPFVVPDEMRFLDMTTLVAPDTFPDDLDVAVAVDTSVRSRVGGLADRMESASSLLVIDHHVSDGQWGDLIVLDPTAGSTAELVYELLLRLGWPISPGVAAAIYTGIVTDTGRFQYSSTSPRTHEVAAQLLRAGVEPDVIGQSLFEEAPFGYYKVASRVLERAVLDVDHRFVWSLMTIEDLAVGGLEYHQTDPLIDLVRMARDTDVAFLLKEQAPGVYKGSLRSRGRVDVAAIARSFGGGGHHNASGFTSSDPIETIVELVVAQLP